MQLTYKKPLLIVSSNYIYMRNVLHMT